MRVVMLGSGNTATVLCKSISKAGHKIVQIASRNEEHARDIASAYMANTASLTRSDLDEADIYIVALHDAALDHIEKIPSLKNKFIVHTAGAISINALKNCSDRFGVLYPLQSLSKFSSHLPEIPFLIDGCNPEVLENISNFAKTMSSKVVVADDTERLHYHISAVFVNNFTNHLYSMTELFCGKEKIDFNNLLPLIHETSQRLEKVSPFLTQTGPAVRNDTFTLNRHLESLSGTPEMKYLYLKLTESIMKLHGIK